MRKGDGADVQRAKVVGNFTTDGEGEKKYSTCVASKKTCNLSHLAIAQW